MLPPVAGSRAWRRDRSTGRGSAAGRPARARVRRLESKRWQIGQCALAAAVAWLIAADLFGHPTPFFAPVAAVVALGTSYGQRLRRVAEVTVGVAVGVFLADLLVVLLGSGWWQIGLIVALSMSAALLLDGGQLFVTQAAVQSIVVASLVPAPGEAFTRWTDAVIGGAVALVAATVVPAAPLRRPREQAAVVMRKIADLLAAAGEVMADGEVGAGDGAAGRRALDRPPDPRAPGRRRRGPVGRRLLAVPGPAQGQPAQDGRPGRPARPGAAQHPGAGPADRGRGLPPAPGADVVLPARARPRRRRATRWPTELAANRMAVEARGAVLAVGEATGRVERSDVLAAEAVLAQLRSVVVDLLMVTGLDQLESTDALPPPR